MHLMSDNDMEWTIEDRDFARKFLLLQMQVQSTDLSSYIITVDVAMLQLNISCGSRPHVQKGCPALHIHAIMTGIRSSHLRIVTEIK